MRTEMDDTISAITNVFAGGDGGVAFIKFRSTMLEMEKQALDGDDSALKICDMVVRFNRILDYVAKH